MRRGRLHKRTWCTGLDENEIATSQPGSGANIAREALEPLDVIDEI
jgi:hypothetical protein